MDYEWDQYEQTDKLVHVDDHEVPVRPYRELPFSGGKSNNNNMFTDGDPEEHGGGGGGLLRPSDELLFRRRALIDMMDGVLEKRWEDELKNDVPTPRCMVVRFLLSFCC